MRKFLDMTLDVLDTFDEVSEVLQESGLFRGQEGKKLEVAWKDIELERKSLRDGWEALIKQAELTHGPRVPPYNPYAVLGVTKEAEDYIVKAAYRAAAKRLHTDAGGNDKQMTRLNRAYEAIKKERQW